MAGFGFSPSDIATTVTTFHKAYRESRNAPERYRNAKAYCISCRSAMVLLRRACDPREAATDMDGLKRQLDESDGVVQALDVHLQHYDQHMAQKGHRWNASRVSTRMKWVVGEMLNDYIEQLQAGISRALGLAEVMLAAQTSLQIDKVLQVLQRSQSVVDQINADPVTGHLHSNTLVSPTQNCLERRGGCICQCHSKSERSGHFLRFALEGLSAVSEHCVPECTRRRVAVSLRLALTPIGISRAVCMALAIESAWYGVRIWPSLQLPYVKKYTSPGFIMLARLQFGHLDVSYSDDPATFRARCATATEQTIADIKRLFSTRQASYLDVDPDGATWIQKLLRCPWEPGMRWAQYELLRFLVQACPSQLAKDPSLLYQVSTWIGEGPHLDILTELLALGLDPGTMDCAMFNKWPRWSNPGWIQEDLTPDPFGIEFLRQCLRADPGFADCDELTVSLLTLSSSDFGMTVKAWTTSKRRFRPNTLGQSALHLAVLSPQRLQLLLQLGLDVDAVDRGGTTPLMYAAAYGEPESVMLLIRAGAHLHLFDQLNKREFIDYAVRFGHLHVVQRLVSECRACGHSEMAMDILDRCLIYYMVNGPDKWQGLFLRGLFDLGADPDAEYVGRGTCLHMADETEEVDTILGYEFTAVHARDKNGMTPLMHVVRFCNPGSVEGLINCGLDSQAAFDQRDDSDWTAFMHLVMNAREHLRPPILYEELPHYQRKAEVTSCFNLLLKHGADPGLTDKCTCNCSPGGCSALTIALHIALGSVGYAYLDQHMTTLPLDILLCSLADDDTRLRSRERDVRRFVDFAQSKVEHTCCAYRRIRSRLALPGNTCVSKVVGLEAPAGSFCDLNPDSTDVRSSLAASLATFYQFLELKSKEQHEQDLVRSKKFQRHGPKRIKSGFFVNTARDTYSTHINGSLRVSSPLQLDVAEQEAWIRWCVREERKLNQRLSLSAWSQRSLAFTGDLKRELERLRDGQGQSGHSAG